MKRSLAHNAGYNIIYKLLNVMFQLISASYVARVLAPEGVGTVARAQNIVSYFVMFAALGNPSYGTREIAMCGNEEAERNTVFSELFAINAVVTTVCLAAYIWLSGYLLPGNTALRMAVGLELFFCYASIEWLYNGLGEYGYISVRNILVKAASLAALCLFVKEESDYVIYALIHCLGIGGNNLYNVFHARKYVKFRLFGLNLKRHILPLFWLLLGAIATNLYRKVDVTMLGFLSDAASVAFYSNSHKIIGLILGLVTAVTGVFLPRLSYLFAANRKMYDKCLSDGLQVLLLLAVPACVGVCVVAENLMLCVFGDRFLPGAEVLRILSAFTIVKGIGDLLCYQTVISSGNERYLIVPNLIGGIANIVLNAILIPRYAHCGAAVASVISELIVNGILLPRVLRITRLSVSAKFCGGILVSTVVMVSGVGLLQNAMGNGAISLLLTVIAGMVIYGLMQMITNGNRIKQLWDSIRKNR